MTNRRDMLRALSAAPLATLLPAARADEPTETAQRIARASATPLKLASVELLKGPAGFFVRSRTTDGAEGLAACSERIEYLYPILTQRVAPFFIGKDARDLPRLIDEVYVHESNYKLAGLALWCCVAWVEFSLIDLLGRVAGLPAHRLIGPTARTEVPVYLSSLRRDTTPEEEIAWLAPRVEETGARAIKIKVGGRMSRNRDASPGRSEALAKLARNTLGPDITIYADANGSYDAAHAITLGRLLEDLNFGFFEEPCPFEDLVATKQVADALTMPVAGGEQDASLPRFERMARERIVDVLQPDVTYNGGLIRASRVALIAATAGLPITPHSPQGGPHNALTLQIAACTPNIGPHLEFRGERQRPADWFEPSFEVVNGVIPVPTGPGLGITYDPAVINQSRVVTGSA